MRGIKVAVGLLLYCTSCIALLITPRYISLLLTVYSTDFPASHGPHIPAFSKIALSAMPHATAICLSILAVSLLLGFLAFRRVKEQDTRLYWIGVLTGVNLCAALALFGFVLIGFFLLPKLANGI